MSFMVNGFNDRRLNGVLYLFSNEGAGGFYKGLGPNLLRVVPSAAITYITYEAILGYIRRAGPVRMELTATE